MDTTKVPLGRTAGPFTTYVDPDEVLAFAHAINDDNSRYLDGAAAPPTYPVSLAFPAVMAIVGLPPEALEGARGGMHGEYDLFIRKPVPISGFLHTTSELASVVTSRVGMNVFMHIRSTDDDGDLVVEHYWSSIYPGPVSGPSRGSPPPDHTFPETARDRLVGRATLPTTRDQTFRYAGASGDRGVIHVNDDVARKRGMPRKFNQGLCTLGVATRGLVDLAADGDPTRVARIAARFAAPAFPGDDIDVAVYDIGPTESGLHAFGFEAESAGRTVLRHGRVEVRDVTANEASAARAVGL